MATCSQLRGLLAICETKYINHSKIPLRLLYREKWFHLRTIIGSSQTQYFSFQAHCWSNHKTDRRWPFHFWAHYFLVDQFFPFRDSACAETPTHSSHNFIEYLMPVQKKKQFDAKIGILDHNRVWPFQINFFCISTGLFRSKKTKHCH